VSDNTPVPWPEPPSWSRGFLSLDLLKRAAVLAQEEGGHFLDYRLLLCRDSPGGFLEVLWLGEDGIPRQSRQEL
jgi:hypothetical protein